LRARTARPRRGPHPREAPLAPAARGAPCGNTSGDTPVSAVARAQTRAAWFFLAPALLLIGLFFFVPVLAGLLLSATDFDVYAIGSPGNARFMGVKNYVALAANPLFWKALGNTLVFVFAGGLLSVLTSLGAALLVSSKRVRWPGLF